MTDLWVDGGGDKPRVRTWILPRSCNEFHSKFNEIQEQLEDLCSLNDLITGPVLSKSKGQILRLSAVFNALFSNDPSLKCESELSSSSVKAAINFIEVCSEQLAIVGGRRNTMASVSCTHK